jgi:hypothetical protein
MDRRLYPVLRTRPGSPRLICLPSTFRYGAMRALASRCFLAGYVDPRFCLRPPSGVHCCSTLAFGYLPLATLRLHQAGYGLCSGPVSQSQASPISSRALPGTQQDTSADAKSRAAEFCIRAATRRECAS